MHANNFFDHIERTVHIGLRKVEVIEDPVQNGNLFYFQVNDVPIYSKGPNLIPFNEWSTSVTVKEMKWALTSCLEANMNMIRVWGGG